MKKIVISVGGSLINPGKLDLHFLKELKSIIKSIEHKYKIVLVTGGGYLAREYMQVFKRKKEKSLIGIQCTQLNARLLSLYLKNTEEISVTLNELKSKLPKEKLLICGGLKEQINTTSDGTSAKIAKIIKADLFINMSNMWRS